MDKHCTRSQRVFSDRLGVEIKEAKKAPKRPRTRGTPIRPERAPLILAVTQSTLASPNFAVNQGFPVTSVRFGPISVTLS